MTRRHLTSMSWSSRRSAKIEAQMKDFGRRVADLHEQTEILREQPGSGVVPIAGFGALREAFDLLERQHEELLAADEELRVQLEELDHLDEQLLEDRRRYRAAFSASSDALFITDGMGVIEEVNPAGESLVRVERRFLEGKPLAAFVHPDDVRRFRNGIPRRQTRETSELVVRVRPRSRERSGEERAIVVAMSIVHLDVHADRLLWRLRREDVALEEHGDDAPGGPGRGLRLHRPGRTRRLSSQGELRKALAQARIDVSDVREQHEKLRADALEKDRMIALFSHELRGALGSILGWSEMLQREKVDAALQARAVGVIHRSAKGQAALLDEMLDVSRLQEDKLRIEDVPLDFARLVQQAVEARLPQADQRSVELSADVGTELVTVSGDALRLHQVVSNLLTNAIKFTPRGGWVRAVLRADHGAARLDVRDSGKGIEPELLPHVFDRFTQGKGNDAGEGLGLGATFTVRLPLVATGRARPPRPPVVRTSKRLEGLKALVVDDEADTSALVAMILGQHGADVRTAAGVDEALALIDAQPVDVLLSELAMPRRTGYELVRELRARPGGTHVAALALTSNATHDEGRRALDAGFDAHVTKPVSADDLVTSVEATARWAR